MRKIARTQRQKWISLTLCIVLSSVASVGCASSSQNSTSDVEQTQTDIQQFQREDVVMGTLTRAVVYTDGEDITSQIMEQLSQVEDDYISWRVEDSDIDKINSSAGDGQGVDVSDSTASYLKIALELSAETDGAFDPTLGKLSRLWNVDGENPKVPEDTEIQKLLGDSGYEKIQLEGEHVMLPQDVSIDLGAVGKGIGCDEAVSFLQQQTDVQGAVISVGGSIVVYGNKPDESPWQVAITNPDDDTDYMGVLSLTEQTFVSTSGDYEKYFEQDGETYHHILDPETGYPAESDLVSVSIVTDNGLLSDGLSTACYVLGMEKSQAVLEHYGAEAIFIDRNHEVYLTDGLTDKFRIVNEDFQLAEKE